MQLRTAKKVYANAFCAPPEQTIERIRDGFRRLGLEIAYAPNATAPTRWFSTSISAPVLGTYSGHAHVRGLPPQFGTNGKGMTSKLAMASALGELCERYAVGVLHSYYSAYARDRELVRDEVYDHLANVKFLPGHVTGHRDDIAGRIALEPALAAGGLAAEDIARLFALPIARNWVTGFSLTERRAYQVPLTLLTTLTGSNGMAAGNTLAEAMTHALGELFERYCTWTIVLGQRPCPTIARDGITDPEIRDVLAQFDQAGIEVIVKDFSLGGVFPVIGAVFRNRNLDELTGPAAQPCRDHFGYTLRAGSAPRRRDALLRCLTEEMQGVLLDEYSHRSAAVPLWTYWIGEMGRAYTPRSRDALIETGVDRRDFNRHGDVRFLADGPPGAYDALWDWRHDDCVADVDASIAICRRIGAHPIAVDTTHPVIGFPSVAVFIPELITASNVFANVRHTLARARGELRLGHPATLDQRLPAQHFEFQDDWLDRPDDLRRLIGIIEGYLGAFFPAHQWHAWRRLWPINLCQLLAYLHVAVGDHAEAVHMAELWRMTGATPGAQRAAAQLARQLRDQLAAPDPAALARGLAAISPEHRFLVSEPRLNPFRHLADQPTPLAWEATWDRALAAEFERFFASFTAGAAGAAQEVHGVAGA